MKREFKVLAAVAVDELEKTLNGLVEDKWMIDSMDFYDKSGARNCTVVCSREKKAEKAGQIGISM